MLRFREAISQLSVVLFLGAGPRLTHHGPFVELLGYPRILQGSVEEFLEIVSALPEPPNEESYLRGWPALEKSSWRVQRGWPPF